MIPTRTAPPLAVTPDCCSEWSSLIGGFYWFRMEDHPDVLAMPCVLAGNRRHRVNHCPSCGASCRGAVTTRDRVESAREGT